MGNLKMKNMGQSHHVGDIWAKMDMVVFMEKICFFMYGRLIGKVKKFLNIGSVAPAMAKFKKHNSTSE